MYLLKLAIKAACVFLSFYVFGYIGGYLSEVTNIVQCVTMT